MRVLAPRSAYLGLAVSCLLGSAAATWLGQVPALVRATTTALALQALLCIALAILEAFGASALVRTARLFALLAAALLSAVPGYFFGPNSGFGALLALLLVLVGLLSTGGGTGRPPLTGWLVYLALAASQAVVLVLVVTRRLPDQSLTRVLQVPHPPWHWVAGHVALQGVLLAAFLAGRRYQKRYQRLALEVDQAVRAAARREALLDEARAEYKRTLAVGLDGVFSGQSLGPYSLGRVLARGGMGELYEATSARDGSRVAVKLLRGDRVADAGAVERFLHESEIAAGIESPHVARVYETGGLDQRMPFIAMERLEGQDLATLLEGQGGLAPAELRRLAGDLTSALSAIHGSGVVHLDVNPRNVMRTADGRWKLVDFGLAQLQMARAPDTQPAGTLRYVAPERLGGGFADARADLYGASACLYAALTGTDPFAEIPIAQLLRAVVDRLPQAPPAGAEVPPEVAEVLRIGLAKRAQDRFATAAELGAAFLGALEGRLEPRWRERALALARALPWGAAPVPVPAPAPAPVPAPAPAPAAAAAAVPAPAPAPAPAAAAAPAAAPASDPAAAFAWQDAFRGKMRGFALGVGALCLGGAVLLRLIIADRVALELAWVCMGGILAAVWLQARLRRSRSRAAPYWPWALVGALTVGPTYALGFHSGFAAVIAVLLFAGGLFRGGMRASWIDDRGLVLASICLAQIAVFCLVLAGVIPDSGNALVREPGVPAGVSLAQHLLVQGVYVVSFVAGQVVDRRYQALTVRAQAVAREAAQKEALLATARAELDRALAGEAGGIFSGLRIGRYRVGLLRGRGGMGEVYAATEMGSGRPVALKLLRADRVGDPASLRRLLREARALRLVESPYVARVVEVAGVEEALPYIAMELIEGQSLASLLRERDRLAPGDVRRLVGDVARGLEHVHRAGVVHRDLKPQNVVLAEVEGAGRWKIVDFGVARMLDAAAGTTQHLIVGTPQYMAPEQALGERVDARSDLYSLCLLVYRALTGSPALGANGPAEAAGAALVVEITDPRAHADLPEDLVLALRLGLATRPRDRFATALELATAFEEAFEERLDPEQRRRARELTRREPWRSR